jgi:ubiquinone/menaquinone biosynthesis C-methylase UbiE
MPLQARHDFLVDSSHDELSRQGYVQRLRMHILNQIGGSMRSVYDKRVKPSFEKSQGRPPKNEFEVRDAMLADNYGQVWSTMMRSCQEMVWDSVIPAVERAQPGLNERVRGLNARYGSLTLDPALDLPRYVTATDIHLMPGNYHTEWAKDDASQGALYDRGRFVYNGAAAGPYADAIPRTVSTYIRRKWPDFKPERALELGCTIGSSTIPFVDAFPACEVHAVDVGAPVLRYAHARAEALGKRVHFHQMNAEAMRFPDASFDLVYSIIMFHETSTKAYRNILRECHRVLRPGGLMIHMELPPVADMDPFEAFYLDWDAYYNNEPYYLKYTHEDIRACATGAGFASDKFFQVLIPDLARSPQAFEAVVGGEIVAKTRVARVGESAKWFTYGAWK